MDWLMWPVAGLVVISLAGGFGLWSRKQQKRLGSLEKDNEYLRVALDRANIQVERSTKPRPTAGALLRLSRRLSKHRPKDSG